MVPVAAGIGLSLFLLTGWIGHAPGQAGDDLRLIVLEGGVDPECTAECSEAACPLPTGNSHEWVNIAGNGWLPGVNSHPCLTYEKSCEEDEHESCDPGEEEEDGLEAVLANLPTSPGPSIRRFLDRNPTRAKWNSHRQSIQLVGCGGTIRGSIILTEAQAAALNDD